jgi:hypothetical protein
VVVAADTAVEGVVMVEAASVAEVSTEVPWVAASMVASPVAAFAEAVHVSRAEVLEADTAEATAMVEATVMADTAMTVTVSPEVFWLVH